MHIAVIDETKRGDRYYMFSEERKNKILEQLDQSERVDVAQLSKLLNVSESTIRRDLKELEEQNAIKRTHGGAVSLKLASKAASVNFEPAFPEKEIQFREEKQAIARKAVQLIRDGDTILLDAGTTTLYLLHELKAFTNLTVVTNALLSPALLDHHAGIELIFLGGTFRKRTQALVGTFTSTCLNMIRVDKCFIGTNAVDLTLGLTTPNMAEAEIKQKMIASSKSVYLLADSSKFGQSSFCKFAGLHEVDTCITNSGLREEYIKGMKELGIRVVIAN